eukprot:gb/GECH01012897.1/.p1 GENE.gb/GECH01012897.1/~~gb/GECH01012897.1/.p1  ORF type:complete len:191 (+),score=55.73 gb/GECH01012897.1/:1-573(+)
MAEGARESYKLAVCGPGGVGKSCITIQYIQNKFVEVWDPTIEDSYRKQTKIDEKVVRLDILDTAGQDEYKALRDEYMRMGDGFLIVFDLTNEKTFEETSGFRNQIIRAKDDPSAPMLVCGNKCDLESERAVKQEKAKSVTDEWNVQYLETSAFKRINIDEAFSELVRRVRNHKGSSPDNQPTKKKPCTIL